MHACAHHGVPSLPTLRVQIALLLHRAGSPYTYRGHGAPPSLIDAAGGSRGGAAGGGAQYGARGASVTVSPASHSPSRRGASSGPASPLKLSTHARDGGGCSASPLHPSCGAGSAASDGFGEAASALRDEQANDIRDRLGDLRLGTETAREALVARQEEEAAIARASAALARGGRGSMRPASSRQGSSRPMTATEQPPQQGYRLIGLAGTAASGLRRAASATAMSARAGGAAPPAAALASGTSGAQHGAGREDLYGQLLAMRRREAVLEAELIAIKTRRRQREAKALGAAKAAAALSPAAARLRDELLVVQRHRDSIAEKQRQLEQAQLRVRPKDLATLQRARELVARTSGDMEEHRRRTEGELSAAQGRIDRLARLQRERLESSHRRRASLQRERLEGRILREELAKEMDSA